MPQMIVKLGPQWARFSPPRTDLTLLGTLERGAGIGALARDPDGRYWQLNGDVQTELNTSRVETALRKAERAAAPRRAARPNAFRPASGPPAPAPTVIVKRRRTLIVPPSQDAEAPA